MKWLFYLVEANVYLCVCYGFYKLVLQPETFYKINRWYLILSVFVAFSLPFFHVRQTNLLLNKGALYPIENSLTLQKRSPVAVANHGVAIKQIPFQWNNFVNWQLAVLIIYLSVVILGLLRVCAGISKIIQLFNNSPKSKVDGVTHVFIEQEQQAFSFFNWLFYDRQMVSSDVIIGHEMVHIRHKHTLDVLLIELIQAFSWFNPFIRFIKADIRLNHEYIVDEQVTANVVSKHDYVMLLINHACTETSPAFANAMYNPEQLKKRINKLGDRKSRVAASFKYLLVLPLVSMLLGISGFAINKDYGFVTMNISGDLKSNSNSLYPPVRPKIVSSVFPQNSGQSNTLNTDTSKENRKTFKASKEKLNNKNNRILADSRQTMKQDTGKEAFDRVYPVYHNGQVSIASTKGVDTAKRYSVHPEYVNGQVRIVRTEIDTTHNIKRK